MLEIKCTNCNYDMVPSNVVTAQEYSKDGKLIYNKKGELNIDSFPDYIAFICHKCGNTKKISFLDIINAEKKIIMNLVAMLRSEKCLETSSDMFVNEDNDS